MKNIHHYRRILRIYLGGFRGKNKNKKSILFHRGGGGGEKKKQTALLLKHLKLYTTRHAVSYFINTSIYLGPIYLIHDVNVFFSGLFAFRNGVHKEWEPAISYGDDRKG